MRSSLLISFSLLSLFTYYSTFSQEYSYTHYDIGDGLAGSTAYCLTQDKQGFIWVGTETGVSRFDGTHFISYTSADGLPDTEVLRMFCDSKGRVWMASFRSGVCYYFNGKFHNQDNDSILGKVRSGGSIENFSEDRDGNLLMQEKMVLHLLTPDGHVIDYKDIEGKPVRRFYSVAAGEGNAFHVIADQDLYALRNGRFTPLLHTHMRTTEPQYLAINKWLMVWRSGFNEISIKVLRKDSIIKRSYNFQEDNHVGFEVIGDSLVYDCRSTGAVELNMRTGAERMYLPGQRVSRLFSDDEGNIWFTTLGRGIFRLNSNEIKNLTLRDPGSQACSAVFINKVDNELLIGADHDMIFRYPLPAGPVSGLKVYLGTYGYYSFVDKTPNGYLLCGGHNRTILTKPGRSKYGLLTLQLKMAVKKNAWELIVGNKNGVFTLDVGLLQIKDTLWRERPTALHLQGDTLYIGTLNGLYRRTADGAVSFLGDSIPFLRRRISSIAGSKDGNLWVSSYDAGLIGWRNGHQYVYLTMEQGLTSDICRTLLVHGNDLWVGTDKGLNRVDVSTQDYNVTHYTAKDGLASDMINTVFADGDMIYAGTPEGVSYFNTAHASLISGCRLVLLGITNSGRSRLSDTSSLRLHYKENNIRFDFAGVSYRSAGNITYRYRLLGLDSGWKTTKETFLEYPTLPYGDYTLQLQATNKFNQQSPVRTLHFTVETPFWRTTWFYLTIVVLFVSFTWLLVSLRVRQLRRRHAQEEELHKRLAETEHMALQAQMNPHFIFNCLNSIQQYIFDQDVFNANKYISGFARLIRATLHNSSRQFISLAEEINYLSAYLSLEKLRFKEKMTYSIDVAPIISKEAEDIYIPPMLIQPYIENSMRHGLRHKTNAGGHIQINIIQEGTDLTFIIEDNGIGREQAARYKTREHIEYQSKGMSLTADRIRLINTVKGGSIRTEVIDLKDPQGGAFGTRVIVRFPQYHQE